MKNEKRNITVQEFIRLKALGLNGLIDSGTDPRTREERLTFVNNINEVQRNKIKEYNVWYVGDSDELLNFYTRAKSIDYNTDPLYNRNKKSYFWAQSSTEGDIKRTHSGMPRNIVDTLVNIIGIPLGGVGNPKTVLESVDQLLKDILEENNFERLLVQKARPLTLVEGWGAWKINWDTSFSDYPILLYYRAEAVDFVYKANQLVAIIYQDYYQDDKAQNYILFETRRLDRRPCTIEGELKGKIVPCLIIEKELFQINGQADALTKCQLSDLSQLKDVKPQIIIENFNSFLGAPNIYYEDSTEDCYGRSIFTGKIDLFDDEDQCHSQAANAVRRSTPTEVWDVNYLEKDEHTGMPIMPHSFDRKYVSFKGALGGDGAMGTLPVQTTQPRIDFTQYSMEEQNILLNIINGIMSPATLGIDIAKKDNATAQREKEKITIFTRNTIIAEESKTLKRLFNDLLVAHQLMHDKILTCNKYSVYVKYDEFADTSWEAKLETVLAGWQSGIMSDEMALETLYKDTLPKEIIDRELSYIKNNKEQNQQLSLGGAAGMSPEELGEFGELGDPTVQ